MALSIISLSLGKMLKVVALALFALVALGAAAPADPVLGVWSEGIRYDYLQTDEGELRLEDNWLKLSDYDRLARYDPDGTNQYHLFTRANPSVSQVLVVNNAGTVTRSNYDGRKRTVILMHGFAGSATSSFNTNLVPAFLRAVDCNVIVLDWSAGSSWGPRAEQAGQAGGRFTNWLVGVAGGNVGQFHIVGYSVGGHGVGNLGRTVNGNVGYITGLDPADRWDPASIFRRTDGAYTEIIHTNVGNIGVTEPLADVDFYPNGGENMPGCITALCDHERAYYYMAESVATGGFTGRRCSNLNQALNSNCNLSETLRMGGHLPKTGRSGIFWVQTNARQPFSRG